MSRQTAKQVVKQAAAVLAVGTLASILYATRFTPTSSAAMAKWVSFLDHQDKLDDGIMDASALARSRELKRSRGGGLKRGKHYYKKTDIFLDSSKQSKGRSKGSKGNNGSKGSTRSNGSKEPCLDLDLYSDSSKGKGKGKGSSYGAPVSFLFSGLTYNV